jgi:hypothetical protein
VFLLRREGLVDLPLGARAAVAESVVTPEGRLRGGRLRGMLETRMNKSYKAREA